MSYEEKGTWVYLVASAGAYAIYLAIVLGRVLSTPVAEVPSSAAAVDDRRLYRRVDRRPHPDPDRETQRQPPKRRAGQGDLRFGEHASRWFVVAGAGAALFMAMARWDYFWIANVLYLGFVLWAIAGSALSSSPTGEAFTPPS